LVSEPLRCASSLPVLLSESRLLVLEAGEWYVGGDMWLPGGPLETADGGECSPSCVWLLTLAVLGAGVVFVPSAAVTMGLRLCMLKVSFRRS
jgi:hypothetical protein